MACKNNSYLPEKIYYCCVPTTVPTFNSYLMAQNTAGGTVAVNEVVPFNTIVENQRIIMATDGTFTIPAEGIYLVNWWVNAANNTGAEAVINTSLNSVTPTAEVISPTTSSFAVGAGDSDILHGVALINATTANSTYNITNTSTIPFDIVLQNGVGATITVNRIN